MIEVFLTRSPQFTLPYESMMTYHRTDNLPAQQ